MYFYQPSQGHGLPHDPLNAIIGPRPIGWIASRDSNGRHNPAPYSFFNCFNYHPPIIGFASSGWKDSVRNIVETGEFVWNLTTLELAGAMNETSASLPHGEDEFFAAGLNKADSRIVSVPRVAQSPVNFECRLSQTLQLTTADGAPVETSAGAGRSGGHPYRRNATGRRHLPDGESEAGTACGWTHGVLFNQ